MKLILSCAITLALISAAAAQSASTPTDTPPATTTTSIAPLAQCPDLPADPAMFDGAHGTMRQMSAANSAQATWREQAHQVLECRRAQYNAVIEHENAVNSAWSGQLDAFCARREIHCTGRENPAPAAPQH
jgi:hypothetical protein